MSDMLTLMAEARFKSATGMTFALLDREDIREQLRDMAAALIVAHANLDAPESTYRDWSVGGFLLDVAEQAP